MFSLINLNIQGCLRLWSRGNQSLKDTPVNSIVFTNLKKVKYKAKNTSSEVRLKNQTNADTNNVLPLLQYIILFDIRY